MTTPPPPPPPDDAWQNTPGMTPEQPSAQQWGAPQGGAAPGYGGHPVKPSNGLGIAALILGILGFFTSLILVGGLLGLIAVILGFIARGKAKRGEATNGGVALGGIIMGILAMLVALAVVVFTVLLVNSTLGDCLEKAGDNQAQVEQCQREFADRHN